MKKTFFGALCFLTALCVFTGGASATEGVLSTHIPGSRDIFAGKLSQTGLYFRYDFNYYQGSSQISLNNKTVMADMDAIIRLSIFRLVYVSDFKIFGGNYAWAVTQPYSDVDVAATLRTPKGARIKSVHYTEAGQNDLVITPFIVGWHGEKWHSVFSLGIYAPTGDYDEKSPIKIGRNRYSADPAFAVTYLNPETLREVSAIMGYTVSAKNTKTDYDSGDTLHLDLTTTQRFSSGFGMGLAGYAIEQVTGDSGAGAKDGEYMTQAFAFGPLVTYTGSINKKNFSLVAKYFREFGVLNRIEGEAFWISAITAL